MTTQPPTLAEQIAAVEWAQCLLEAMTASRLDLGEEIEGVCRDLKAAAETMRTWEFAREVLK